MLAGYVPAYGPPTKADIARSCNQTASIDLVTVGNAASTLVVVSVPALPGTFCGGRPRGPGGGPGGSGGGLILVRGGLVTPGGSGPRHRLNLKVFGEVAVPAAVFTITLTTPLSQGLKAITSVSERTKMDVARSLSKSTSVVPPRLVPVMTTGVPAGPRSGAITVTVGACAAANV